MCFLRVHGPDLALALFRDALAVELRNDIANEGFRWTTVDAASQPVGTIVLTTYQNGSPAGGKAIAALLAKGAWNGAHPDMDDLDATVHKVGNSPAELRSRT